MRKRALNVAFFFTLVVIGLGAWAQQSMAQSGESQAVLTVEYIRTSGQPVSKCKTFPANPGRGTVTVINGSENGDNRISSAVIELNGLRLFDPRSFNQKRGEIRADVDLLASNTICARLASGPRGFLVISITQQIPALISGIVRDRTTGLPVANARVFFYGTAYGTILTDANGRYTFTAGQLVSFGGAISGNLYVGATGYFEAPPVFVSDLNSQSSLPVVEDITLLPGGIVIQGTVRDATTGQGISGAVVSFTRNPMSTFLGGGVTELLQTQADGSYAIDSSYFNESGLVSGFSANLMVNASGYLGMSRTISFSTYPSMQHFDLKWVQ